MIVVIDGPAGSGKSSTARAVARRLKIQFLDSGALYRVATLLFLNSGKDYPSFFEALKESKISFYFKENTFHVFLNDREVTSEIREMNVSEQVSEVASSPDVRSFINKLMRDAVQHNVYIADGRDLGTAVFPDADLKYFMIADLQTRARRRFNELKDSDPGLSFEEVKQNIAQRDEKDSGRKADPLVQADDARTIDTSQMTFEEQVSLICEEVSDLIHSRKN